MTYVCLSVWSLAFNSIPFYLRAVRISHLSCIIFVLNKSQRSTSGGGGRRPKQGGIFFSSSEVCVPACLPVFLFVRVMCLDE